MICIFSGKAWWLILVLSIKGFALLYLFQQTLSKTLGFQNLLEYGYTFQDNLVPLAGVLCFSQFVLLKKFLVE